MATEPHETATPSVVSRWRRVSRIGGLMAAGATLWMMWRTSWRARQLAALRLEYGGQAEALRLLLEKAERDQRARLRRRWRWWSLS